jgi:TRAP-type mannitol/chloroaromatic compound transport system permease small subunit
MKSTITVIEKVTTGIGYATALLIIPLVIATCYEVFARYIFGAPTIWAFELGYSIMGVHFLLGAALTLRRGAHIRIDLIYAHLKPRTQAIIDLVLYVCFLAPFLIFLSDWMLSFAYDAFISGERTGQSAWNPPIWPFRFLISSAIVVLLLQVIAEILKCIVVLVGKDQRSAEA